MKNTKYKIQNEGVGTVLYFAGAPPHYGRRYWESWMKITF